MAHKQTDKFRGNWARPNACNFTTPETQITVFKLKDSFFNHK